MACFGVPVIALKDHNAVVRILNGDWPSTYDEWLYFQAKEIARIQGGGHTTVKIEFRPDEFVRDCAARGVTPDKNALDNFIFEKVRLKAK